MRTVLLVLAFCVLTAFATHATHTEPDADKLSEALRGIATQLREALALTEQALGQAQSEKMEADCYSSPTADCILMLVVETVNGIDDTWLRVKAWRDIAAQVKAQIEAGNIAGAVQMAKGIDDTWSRVQALCDIALRRSSRETAAQRAKLWPPR